MDNTISGRDIIPYLESQVEESKEYGCWRSSIRANLSQFDIVVRETSEMYCCYYVFDETNFSIVENARDYISLLKNMNSVLFFYLLMIINTNLSEKS